MAVILLLFAVSISFVVVRIGATALELTGIPWEEAKFQALSAFSNAGFTTAESEDITRHPLRRRIASTLIVLGNAGLVATVGSFAGTLLQTHELGFFLNLGMLGMGLAVLVWVARWPRLSRKIRQVARTWLEHRYALSDYSPEDLLHLREGFRLTRFEVAAESPAIGRSLQQLRLKQNSVQILAIERQGAFIPTPRGNDVLQPGDLLVVFGKEQSIERLFGSLPGRDLMLVGEPEG